MDSQGKAKVALTFALYQGDQLVRRETITQDIVKVGKDPREPSARRRRARVAHARGHRGRVARGHHADRSRQRAGHDGERRARQQVQDPPGRSDPDRLDARSCSRAPSRVGRRRRRGRPAPRAYRRPRRARRLRVAGAPRRGRSESVRRREPVRGGAAPAANPFAGANPFAAPRALRRPLRSRSVDSVRGAGVGAAAMRTWVSASTRRSTAARATRTRWSRAAPTSTRTRSRSRTSSAVEVMILWDTNVLHVSHLTPPRSFYVGEEQGKNVTCDFFIPTETLGTTRAPIVVVARRRARRSSSSRARRGTSRSRARPR